MSEYFRKYGQAVADNGYTVIPIRLGSKAPLGLDWSQRGGGADDVVDWLKNGFTHEYWLDKATKTRGTRTWSIAGFGIGVLTESTPAVDIDCENETVAQHMIEFTTALVGETICRVGLAPKSLLLYRAARSFAKVNSATYIDDQGRNAKLEVLGAGQQFVALAVHPGTGKPYRWVDQQAVHNTPLASLPELTIEQAQQIRDEFDRVAAARGWAKVNANRQLVSYGAPDKDDPFADVAPKVVGVDEEEMRRLTLLVPGVDDYQNWLEIGMALFHQFDGADIGLDIWDEWSQPGKEYGDGSVLRDKWATFDIDGKGRAPLTARVILERSKQAVAEDLKQRAHDAEGAIFAARDVDDLIGVCNPLKALDFTDLTRNMLVGKLRERYKTLTNTMLPIADARKMLRHERPGRTESMPWLTGYVYVQFEESFFNHRTGTMLSAKAFDATYSRELLSARDILEGKAVPDNSPRDVAMNQAQIPVVAKRMYMPGYGELFSINDEDFVNRFTERSVPLADESWTVAGKAAVARVEAHAVHMFENDRDRGLFLDFLAYIVQTNDRVGWGVFIQGVGGDGKTFFGDMMTAVLGMANAAVIRGAELKEKYTGWAEGSLFVFVEEVRLTGEHRYDAINNIKPYLTNGRVPIRRMQTDLYSIINRTSYVLTSNFKDGLPATEGDRYLVLFSRWQDKAKLAAWKAAHPSYFAELFGCLSEAGALRKWLLERKLSSEFDPRGRAPNSSDMDEMNALVVDDESDAFRRVIDDGRDADFSRTLLDSALVTDRMTGSGVAAPQGRRLRQLMSAAGMTWLGETGFGGKTRRWWSDEPSRFRRILSNGTTKIDAASVQKWLDEYL